MNNFILFTNSFLSYLLLFGIVVILAIVAIMIGTSLSKRKNAQTSSDNLETAQANNKKE